MRDSVGIGAAVVSGLLLFFLCFAAVFNGLLALLTLFLSGFVIAGFVVARFSQLRPRTIGFALVAPVSLLALQLSIASVAEAGAKAPLWPLALALTFGLSVAGAKAGGRARQRN